MKRIFIALLFLSGTITNSFAEVGAKVGITAALGYFETSAKEKEEVEISATELPNIHQQKKEMAARQITDGTKTPAILSASF